MSGMSKEMRDLIDETFNAGAKSALGICRDALVKACFVPRSYSSDDTLDAVEIQVIINNLIKEVDK